MQWKPYERARLAHRIRAITLDLSDIGDALSSLKAYSCATKVFEASLELFAVERELLELSPKTGAPPIQEDLPYSPEDAPF